MTVSFYKNLSDNRVVNKSLTTLKSGVLVRNQPIDRDRPILTVDYNQQLIEANYCYIDKFKRYYYIQSIESNSRGLSVVCGNCDVLMSFKDYLKDLECIVTRQENRFNKYLIDEKQLVYSYSRIQTVPFPNGFNSDNLVLAIAGGY